MITISITEAVVFEHRFWLQILGDHARFIFISLAPSEAEYLMTAQEFIHLFDQLLNEIHKELTQAELESLNRKAYEASYKFREFKLELLAMSLTSDLKTHLPPSFYNDMLNELEEYLFILNSLMNGICPLLHPVHYHILWLTDAVGHAATLIAELDFVEKDLIDKSRRYEKQFQDLNIKSQIMNGYLRTQLGNFPALERLNEQACYAVSDFMDFLEELKYQRTDGKVLGTLLPLMADHMAREECYYLWKLSQTTQNIRQPDCDPGRPRIEI